MTHIKCTETLTDAALVGQYSGAHETERVDEALIYLEERLLARGPDPRGLPPVSRAYIWHRPRDRVPRAVPARRVALFLRAAASTAVAGSVYLMVDRGSGTAQLAFLLTIFTLACTTGAMK